MEQAIRRWPAIVVCFPFFGFVVPANGSSSSELATDVGHDFENGTPMPMLSDIAAPSDKLSPIGSSWISIPCVDCSFGIVSLSSWSGWLLICNFSPKFGSSTGNQLSEDDKIFSSGFIDTVGVPFGGWCGDWVPSCRITEFTISSAFALSTWCTKFTSMFPSWTFSSNCSKFCCQCGPLLTTPT